MQKYLNRQPKSTHKTPYKPRISNTYWIIMTREDIKLPLRRRSEALRTAILLPSMNAAAVMRNTWRSVMRWVAAAAAAAAAAAPGLCGSVAHHISPQQDLKIPFEAANRCQRL